MWERPSVSLLQKSIQDSSNPIGMRMRAAYYLRQVYQECKDNEKQQQELVLNILSDGIFDVSHGSLMRHEFAYVLGQIRDERCCAVLERTVQNDTDCVMVRHEAAEALGAIGAERSIASLESVITSASAPIELIETCQLSVDVMEWRRSDGGVETMPAVCACMLNPYNSVDPAPPHPSHANMSIPDIGAILYDSAAPLFLRYRAMFSLRNRGGDDAVQQLCKTLERDTSSTLLRHEIAYVLGQLQHADSVPTLETCLRRSSEHSMVRHEAAEALGAIDAHETWETVERILQEFCHDADDVVRESCLVALDAADYWSTTPVHEDLDSSKEEKEEEIATTNVSKSDGVVDSSTIGNSFTKQKNERRGVLINHFNVVQE